MQEDENVTVPWDFTINTDCTTEANIIPNTIPNLQCVSVVKLLVMHLHQTYSSPIIAVIIT